MIVHLNHYWATLLNVKCNTVDKNKHLFLKLSLSSYNVCCKKITKLYIVCRLIVIFKNPNKYKIKHILRYNPRSHSSVATCMLVGYWCFFFRTSPIRLAKVRRRRSLQTLSHAFLKKFLANTIVL